MAKIKHMIIRTKNIHTHLERMIDNDLISWVYIHHGLYMYTIVGRYGTNRTTLTKILKEHIDKKER